MEENKETDVNVQKWKIKKLVKFLERCKGNGTSMISLMIPPKDNLAKVGKLLDTEFGTAQNIKSKMNRNSVLSGITSTREKLKLYNKVPANGLIIYCGLIQAEGSAEKKYTIDFEPFRPINISKYLCDSNFFTEPLK